MRSCASGVADLEAVRAIYLMRISPAFSVAFSCIDVITSDARSASLPHPYLSRTDSKKLTKKDSHRRSQRSQRIEGMTERRFGGCRSVATAKCYPILLRPFVIFVVFCAICFVPDLSRMLTRVWAEFFSNNRLQRPPNRLQSALLCPATIILDSSEWSRSAESLE
jgi:hypothetical protein